MAATGKFKTRARIITQLGQQLIKNESIALLELIKNSYDADASKCDVVINNITNKKKGEIIIEDDGEGMDLETLSTAWLEIGTSYKDDLLKNPETKLTHKYKRLRLGEKGIGRLGVHRLGKEVEIITKKAGHKECVLKINWENLSKTEYLEDFPVEVSERKPQIFKKGTGTRITIKSLKGEWTRDIARRCNRAITSLNSPFESDDSFRVQFKIPGNSWLEGLLTFDDIEQYKLFSFDILMVDNQVIDFEYRFTPWTTMKKLSPRTVTILDNEIKNLTRMIKSGKDKEDIDLELYKIGPVRFKGIIFDRDTRILNLGVQDRLGLKNYLNENGGIRVFRDNMRVFDYGEQGNDWLDLDGRRVNVPAKRISNNIVLAAVYLRRSESSALEEKANREGFVENEAYWELWEALRFAIDRVESLRKTDKDLLRLYYGPQKTNEPVLTSISELKELVEKNIKEESIKNNIYKYLDRISDEYDEITRILIKSAGAGLNLIIIIHQIEKITKDISQMLKKKASAKVLEERVTTLSSLIDGYTILIKKSDKKLRSLKPIIEQSIFNINFRLEAHGIELENAFLAKKTLKGICSEDHVLNALLNIFDNSIWWLGYSKIKKPSIYLDISDEIDGFSSVVIADNGHGFSKPTSEIVKPFVTDKPGGMGIGLHITQQIMDSLNGRLLFPELDYFNIPKKYQNGAIIALAFKSGEK